MADRSKRTETAGKREKLVKQERKNREQPKERKRKSTGDWKNRRSVSCL